MHRRMAVAALVLGVFLAACRGSGASPAPSGPVVSPLPAGTYTTTKFQPAVTFTLPDGWEWPLDSDVMLTLRPAGSEISTLNLFRDARAASQATDCSRGAEPGVGTTSTELVAWIRERPGLVVSNPMLSEIGALRGVGIDLGIREGWTESCPFANGNPTVPLITGTGDSYHWIVYGSERMRMYVLDLPGGGTVTVSIDTVVGPEIDGLIGQAMPIIRSLQFASG